MSILSNTRAFIGINIFLILSASILFNSFLNYKNYTLEKNGNWESTKTTLKGVPGVYANMFTKPALDKNQLNLAVWFGYQELIYHKPVNATTLRFKYQCWDYPFSLILHKSDSLTYGIYFHYRKDSTCCLFVSDKEGKFLFKQNFYTGPARKKWDRNNAEVRHSADSIYLSINNQICLSALFQYPETTKFGFRGGAYPVYIDDIIALNKKGEAILKESFTPNFELNWEVVIFVSIFFTLLFSFYKSSYKSWLTAFNMSVLLGFIACYLLYFFYLSYQYPITIDSVDWHGKTVTFDIEDTVCNRLKSQFTDKAEKPVILFIGSSQTWGAGASTPQQTYPALAEKNLRSYFNDSAITVINSGICGTSSEGLYKHYEKDWYKLRPLLTVIDLSHNDRDTALFKKYIRKFLEFNQVNNIRTLLIAEPNDFVFDAYLKVNHRNMTEEGLRAGVETVYMQDYTNSAYETGFLWWDWVHMTDYGYRVFAKSLTPYIIKELEGDSLLLKFNASVYPQNDKDGLSRSAEQE